MSNLFAKLHKLLKRLELVYSSRLVWLLHLFFFKKGMQENLSPDEATVDLKSTHPC